MQVLQQHFWVACRSLPQLRQAGYSRAVPSTDDGCTKPPIPGAPVQRIPSFPRGAPMNQFLLVETVDRFGQRVIVAVASAADRRLDAGLGQTFAVPNADVLSPLSEWGINVPSSPGWRTYSACPRASRTKAVVIDELTRQPTIRRGNTSITNATYSQPCHVET